MIPEKKQRDIVLELLLLFYRMRIRMLVIGTLVFLVTFMLFKIYYITYSSTVTFLIDNSDPVEIAASETEQFAMSQLRELSNNRMYLILFSDEMAKRLDEKIGIGKHFGLNQQDTNYVYNILAAMHRNVTIEKGISNTVKITVKDNNKEFAAAFANSIYSNLVEINKKIVRSNINYKKEIYRQDIEHLDSQNKEDVQQFLTELNKLQINNKSVKEKPDEMLLLRQDLFQMFTEYTVKSAELKRSVLKYQDLSGALNDSTLQNLYLVNKAYPQSNTNSYVRATFWSLGIALAFTFYYGLLLLFIQRVKISFRELTAYNGNPHAHLTIPSTGVKKSYLKSEEINTD